MAFDETTGIASYDTVYRREADGKMWHAQADIRFSTKSHIATLMAEAGLKADQWLADWSGAPWTPESPEIIPVGGLR